MTKCDIIMIPIDYFCRVVLRQLHTITHWNAKHKEITANSRHYTANIPEQSFTTQAPSQGCWKISVPQRLLPTPRASHIMPTLNLLTSRESMSNLDFSDHKRQPRDAQATCTRVPCTVALAASALNRWFLSGQYPFCTSSFRFLAGLGDLFRFSCERRMQGCVH